MINISLGETEISSIEYHRLRADKFVRQSESVRKQALDYRSAQFFANLAYQRAFLCQANYLQGANPNKTVDFLRSSVEDFIISIKLGYPVEATEVNNWFYRSLVVNRQDLSLFFIGLIDDLWSAGDLFSRYQAHWGFEQFQGNIENVKNVLEVLFDLITDVDDQLEVDDKIRKIRWNQNNLYSLMYSIFVKDSVLFTNNLIHRANIRSVTPPEGVRYEILQPLDFIALGLCRLAINNKMRIDVERSILPMDLLKG